MWIGKTSRGALRADPRWLVSLHSRSGTPTTSRYPRVRLGELVVERGERLEPMRWPDFRFCYLSLQHIQSQSGLLEGFAPVTGGEVRSQCRVFRPDDVLYGRLRPYLNKVYLAEPPVHTGICSAEFLVLVPDTARVRPLFLRALLSSGEVQGEVAKMQLGSALPRLHLKDLLAMRLPLPPLDVQAEIEASLRAARRSLQHHQAAAAHIPVATRASLEHTLRTGAPLSVSPTPPRAAPDWPDALPDDHRPGVRRRGRPRRG
jgi:hypothetical protein